MKNQFESEFIDLYEITVGGEVVYHEMTDYDAAYQRYGEICEHINNCAGPRTVALWENMEVYPVKEETCGFTGEA
jgi:hypothetical protein